MAYHAQLGADNIAVSVTETPDALVAEGFIALESLDASVLGKRWTGADWDDVARVPVAAPLDEAALIDLCQSAGGMTDAQLVAAFNDANLAAFWIKLRAASTILPTDQRMQDGLAAVDALGYLPKGAQAVLDAWPTA